MVGNWTLERLRQCEPLQGLKTIGGVCRRLHKWRIARKQSRLHLTSPDPEYQHKMEQIEQARCLARQFPEQVSLFYADEITFYRQPCLGATYYEQGFQQPTAPYPGRANTKRRIVGALDVTTGQVHAHSASVIGVKALAKFLCQVRQSLGPQRRVIVVWDNWPVHKHPAVAQAAQEQRIELLYVPTYAPWTNPIEKFWKKFKAQVLRNHRLSEHWEQLREQVEQFLQEHQCPRPDLLRYVGLTPELLPT
jgi:putative transposase